MVLSFHFWGTHSLCQIHWISWWRLVNRTGPPSFSTSRGMPSTPGVFPLAICFMALTTSSTSGSTASSYWIGLSGTQLMTDLSTSLCWLSKVFKCSSQRLRMSSHWVRRSQVVEFMGWSPRCLFFDWNLMALKKFWESCFSANNLFLSRRLVLASSFELNQSLCWRV